MSQPGYWQLREAVERDARLFRDFAASCRLRNPGQAWLMLKRVEALERILNPESDTKGIVNHVGTCDQSNR